MIEPCLRNMRPPIKKNKIINFTKQYFLRIF